MSDSFPNLQPILAPSQALIMNGEDRTLQLLTIMNERPTVVIQQQFSGNEWRVLIPILRAYPKYASYEVLLTALTNVPLAVSRQRLAEARQNKTIRQELRAIRDALFNLSEKLVAFGFTYASIYERGYTLALLSSYGEEIRDSTSFFEI